MEGSKMLSSAATSIFRRKEAAAKPAHCIAFRVRERKGRARQHALTEERRDGAVENTDDVNLLPSDYPIHSYETFFYAVLSFSSHTTTLRVNQLDCE